jgi:2-oxoglutarate ferredoxin oxidoreductase subunit gamma
MEKFVRICGFGGQGVILAGVIIGKAAAVYDGLECVQSQSYGPEARGGASRTEVIISDKPIGYPRLTSCHLMMALSQEAFDTYKGDLVEDATIILDPEMVKKIEIQDKDKKKIYEVKGMRIAKELGKTIVFNIIMVGAMTAIAGTSSKENILKAVIESVPAKFIDLNKKAFELGYEAGKNALEETA